MNSPYPYEIELRRAIENIEKSLSLHLGPDIPNQPTVYKMEAIGALAKAINVINIIRWKE
jgi:hypothetical protein